MTVQKLTGGQMVVDILIREGVEKVFAIPGHGNTALLDAFVDRADEIELVPAIHEQGAAHMADGYYRASGKIAAVCTSIGPGATNTVTGIATAFADSQPMILITGAVHTYMENRGVLQEIDRPHGNNFPRMVEPVVKRWWQPGRLEQLPSAMAQAFNTMLEGRRGPVLVDIPQDLQAEYGDYVPELYSRRAQTRATGDPVAIAEAAKLLAPKWTMSGTLNYDTPLASGRLNLNSTLSYRSKSQQFELAVPGIDQKGFVRMRLSTTTNL